MKWAFVFITAEGDGSNGKMHKDIRYGDDRLLMYGVNTLEQGLDICKMLVYEEGCTMIELCGGFGKKGALKVSQTIDSKVPVGYTVYLPEAQERLSILDGAKNAVCAFFFKTDKADASNGKLKTILDHGTERLMIYGVNTADQAIDMAKKLIGEGCILIEVSGELGIKSAKTIINEIKNKIPIGHVEYLPKN